jgi:hypothetical protein
MRERAKNVLGWVAVLWGIASVGCASNPVAPFDSFKDAPITAYRLQNYEPPPQAAATPTAPGQIPGLPPEIQKWLQAGAQMLPPGLPANVIDSHLRDELINIFGFEKNFDDTHGSCVYAEFGFSFARIGQPPADVLVSLSCDQVQSQNFLWPHRSTGLTADSATRIVKVSQAIFVGG